MSGHQCGTRYQDHFRQTERSQRQVRVLERRDSDSKRDIDALFNDINPAVGRLQRNADLGIGSEISAENIGHSAMKEAGRATDPNDPARRRQCLIDRVLGRFGLGNQRHAVAVEGGACFGQGQLARGAIEQADAELLLQRTNPPTQLRGLHAERQAGSRVAAEIHDSGEKVEVIQIFERLHGADSER